MTTSSRAAGHDGPRICAGIGDIGELGLSAGAREAIRTSAPIMVPSGSARTYVQRFPRTCVCGKSPRARRRCCRYRSTTSTWQTYYMFKEPIRIPAGARILSSAWYDNSAPNRANPDPSVDVRWGDQTWEEMQYTGLLYSVGQPPAVAAR